MKDIKTISKEELLELIQEWANKHFGENFKYRPHQCETICDIIYTWFHEVDNVILEAPTGSGKSFIALSVAGVLSEYFGKTGYVLISDLSLIEQYERDIKTFFPEWSVIKGQQSYKCAENGLIFPLGICQLKNIKSYGRIQQEFLCSEQCEYINERMKAMSSPVTVCTYAFWLIQQNSVKPKVENPPFDSRDFVICDEAHKLTSIIQSAYSPRFGKDDIYKIESVVKYSDKIDNSIIGHIKKMRNQIMSSSDNTELVSLLSDYVNLIEPIFSDLDAIKKGIIDKKDDDPNVEKGISREERSVLYNCDFFKEHFTAFNDYVELLQKIDPVYLVKNDSDDGENIIFNCLDESYLMYRYFHCNCRKRLYMSATIGDPDIYQKEIAVEAKRALSIPSIFDYTNSPIFLVGNYKMSYSEKANSMPYIIKMVEGIFEIYKNYRGIIQTGSYAFAYELLDKIDPKYKRRILIYDNSESKKESINLHKLSSDGVLVGPSLVEGLSFDDDLCRFQIIIKVPYPSLKDKFVSAKLNFNPAWYSNSTAISILQGVGRGIRNEKDWCVTFILDGCFMQLATKSGTMFSEDFRRRVQIISPESLYNKNNMHI